MITLVLIGIDCLNEIIIMNRNRIDSIDITKLILDNKVFLKFGINDKKEYFFIEKELLN